MDADLYSVLSNLPLHLQVADFKHGAIYKMMIASYETLRKFCKELEKCADLLVCDEGHRLKASGGSKTIDALLSLQCSRRILLTGTPVQNNLEEFHGVLLLHRHTPMTNCPRLQSRYNAEQPHNPRYWHDLYLSLASMTCAL